MSKTVIHGPVISPEARENQMIGLAEKLAEQQLREGTASAQVIVHYLKLATTRERLEKELLAKQMELMEAKTSAISSTQRDAEMYEKAIAAMKNYGGSGADEDESY